MARLEESYRHLARTVDTSAERTLRWDRSDPDGAFYYFLAQRMARAGLVEASIDEESASIHYLTDAGRKLLREDT